MIAEIVIHPFLKRVGHLKRFRFLLVCIQPFLVMPQNLLQYFLIVIIIDNEVLKKGEQRYDKYLVARHSHSRYFLCMYGEKSQASLLVLNNFFSYQKKKKKTNHSRLLILNLLNKRLDFIVKLSSPYSI